MRNIIKWTPRILMILFILFISIFSLDVFGVGYGFLETLVALFMHLIPTFVLIALLVLAWKSPKWGGYTFLAISVVFFFFFDGYESIVQFLIIVFPVLLVGGLFLLDHYKK